MKVLPRIISFLLFALLIGIIAFWASRLMAPATAIAPAAVNSDNNNASNSSWTKQLFGNAPSGPSVAAGPVADSQLAVLGVITGGSGAAVISIEGKPGKAFGVGELVTPGVRIREITSENVVIDRNGSMVKLAAPPKADLAVLTSGVGKTRGASGDTPTGNLAPLPQTPVYTPPPVVPSQGISGIQTGQPPPAAGPIFNNPTTAQPPADTNRPNNTNTPSPSVNAPR
jgi:general secretion pathway protein C